MGLSICDLQEKFRGAIHEFDKIILNIPIHLTTQNAARLGPTVPEITADLPESAQVVDKTAFSMIPSIEIPSPQSTTEFSTEAPVSVLLLGIEAHICVLQTTLDLLRASFNWRPVHVYLLVDGISSCNAGERSIALRRLEQVGSKKGTEGEVILTTSESILFELLKDAQHEKFREISKLVKETKEETAAAVAALCSGL